MSIHRITHYIKNFHILRGVQQLKVRYRSIPHLKSENMTEGPVNLPHQSWNVDGRKHSVLMDIQFRVVARLEITPTPIAILCFVLLH